MNENDSKNTASDAGSGASPSTGPAAAPENQSGEAEPLTPANDSGANAAGTEAADPKDARIAELESELASLKDNALRAMAEAENVRKRAEKQVQDANRYGAASLARDVLVVADNLQRALDSAPADQAEDNELMRTLREGVEMTLRDLLAKLEAHGVKQVEPKPGDKFDHNLHQAMFEAPNDEVPPGTIAQVVQAGYVLHDRLLRAAMVGVASGKPAAPGSAQNAGQSPS